MNNQFHILNGDALKEQFPASIDGELIIARECLVDGDVEGDTLEEFMATRAKFISQNYGGTEENYFEKILPEFEKIKAIPPQGIINLWFEDDLFCQVNLWFIIHFLKLYNKTNTLNLVRPNSSLEYGFGGMNEKDLIRAFQNKTRINPSDFKKLAQLWHFYQKKKNDKLFIASIELSDAFPFLFPAVEAHLDRIPSGKNHGKPMDALLKIMDDLNTKKLGPIFQAFKKKESIYGFGDMQVKRMLLEIEERKTLEN